MITSNDLSALARDFHAALPARIRAYLNGRGIPDTVIDHHQLGWNGTRITIPITNREGIIVFFRLARDPDEQAGPKMIAPPGSRIELYGWERVLIKPDRIIICEGEFDRLVLESQGFGAVTSTGGAKSFRPSWVADFEPISDVLVDPHAQFL